MGRALASDAAGDARARRSCFCARAPILPPSRGPGLSHGSLASIRDDQWGLPREKKECSLYSSAGTKRTAGLFSPVISTSSLLDLPEESTAARIAPACAFFPADVTLVRCERTPAILLRVRDEVVRSWATSADSTMPAAVPSRGAVSSDVRSETCMQNHTHTGLECVLHARSSSSVRSVRNAHTTAVCCVDAWCCTNSECCSACGPVSRLTFLRCLLRYFHIASSSVHLTIFIP